DYRRGKIITRSSIVSSPQEKAALFRETGALAVDMENAIVREIFARAGVPVVGVRAISDTAGQGLDPRVLQMMDDQGRARPIFIAASVLKRPTSIVSLVRLGKASKLAASNLGRAVREIVQSPACSLQ